MSKAVPLQTTIEIRDGCLCLHAQRAARALARRFDEVMRPFGLTNQQFSLLMALNRPDPPTMAPVAELLAMDRTTLTAALKPLEQRGLLAIESDPNDKRSRRIRLTRKGHAALLRALPKWREIHAEIEQAQPDINLNRLRSWLRSLA
jgi:DNA-binding MarR family transcriptional regulator